jgi:hypothetical protein
MRLTLRAACCGCIQASCTAAVAQRTLRPFLGYPAPPVGGCFLSAGASLPRKDGRLGLAALDAQPGAISQSTCVTCFRSPQGRALSAGGF